MIAKLFTRSLEPICLIISLEVCTLISVSLFSPALPVPGNLAEFAQGKLLPFPLTTPALPLTQCIVIRSSPWAEQLCLTEAAVLWVQAERPVLSRSWRSAACKSYFLLSPCVTSTLYYEKSHCWSNAPMWFALREGQQFRLNRVSGFWVGVILKNQVRTELGSLPRKNTDGRKVTESFLEGSLVTFISLTFAHSLTQQFFLQKLTLRKWSCASIDLTTDTVTALFKIVGKLR